MLSTKDSSFILDYRYGDLLSGGDRTLAEEARRLKLKIDSAVGTSLSDLSDALGSFGA